MNTALLHILTPISAAVILNGYIYSQGWNNKNMDRYNKYLPPGYIIAIVWIIIFGLLGYTHFVIYPSSSSIIIVLAIVYCLCYPFLTSGLQASKADLYNALSFVIATAVFTLVYIENQKAVIYIVPFVLWTSYVNIVA